MKNTILLFFLFINCFAQKGELVIAQYASNIITLHFINSEYELTCTETIDISNFGGWLSSSKYNSKTSYHPIQFSSNGDLIFISIINDDEMEGVSYWTKFLSYDLKSKELKELTEITGTSISFWYLLNDKEIIGINEEILFKLDFEQSKYDTLLNYSYHPQPVEIVASDSTIDFLIEARKNLSALRYNINSTKFEEIFLASTTSFSSIHNQNLLTIEGFGLQILKLRKSGLYAIVSIEKKIDLSNFNSYWDNENNIYLMEENGILKLDENLDVIARLKCNKPHIMEIIDNWIIYSTRKDGQSVDQEKHFASKTDFSMTIPLPFLNNGQSLELIKKNE